MTGSDRGIGRCAVGLGRGRGGGGRCCRRRSKESEERSEQGIHDASGLYNLNHSLAYHRPCSAGRSDGARSPASVVRRRWPYPGNCSHGPMRRSFDHRTSRSRDQIAPNELEMINSLDVHCCRCGLTALKWVLWSRVRQSDSLSLVTCQSISDSVSLVTCQAIGFFIIGHVSVNLGFCVFGHVSGNRILYVWSRVLGYSLSACYVQEMNKDVTDNNNYSD